jgi:hypothetical protein
MLFQMDNLLDFLADHILQVVCFVPHIHHQKFEQDKTQVVLEDNLPQFLALHRRAMFHLCIHIRT